MPAKKPSKLRGGLRTPTSPPKIIKRKKGIVESETAKELKRRLAERLK